MKYVSGCVILSDGSFLITSYPSFCFSEPYKILVQDINNNVFWSGSNSKHQTEVAIFTSRFDLPQSNL